MKTRIMLNGKDNQRMIGVGIFADFTVLADYNADAVNDFVLATTTRTRFITLSYELGRSFLKDTFQSENTSRFPLLQIWVPESLYTVNGEDIFLSEGIDSEENKQIARNLFSEENCNLNIEWKAGKSKNEYLDSVNELKKHIQRGDIYETNFCQEFYSENVEITNGAAVFRKLDKLTNAPFSVYLESDKWLIASASPERFLLREKSKLISQPIKGTAPRSADFQQDLRNKEMLSASEKDRSENVMIVDLVRNDLSRIAAKNSVRVDELFGIHTFPTVHQMISTISCSLREDVKFTDILETTFPMGSMTGAPKISAVRLSDKYEGFSRGIYSGSIGYISPLEESFDLNVMIRSLFYDKDQKRISCCVGGAITSASVAEDEYLECQTKVGRILELFGTCQW